MEAAALPDTPDAAHPPRPRRVFLLGASGTIGRAMLQALLRRRHEVVAFVRPGRARAAWPAGAIGRAGDVLDPASLARDGFRGERFDVLVSCLASRTGVPADAWAIDHRAHLHALEAARAAGVTQVVLLSAICVQKPRLAFQHAKLAFEQVLMASELDWTIVRPTAFFKSLSGQVERVRRGRPFLVFGDGTLTACKPIADEDLADFLADCIDDPVRSRRVLPIGGPGPAITPRQQGEMLFELLGRTPRLRQVPVGLLDTVAGVLGAAGRVLPALTAKAELARIGRYYATESMLMWDPVAGRYDADATPSTGTRTLFDHYARLLRGEAVDERREHAVF
ncbi:MAG: NAD(P)H-binding protein [Rubrivivax sp.]|nr:NAD(P)H-binding protein [Rubrivivax sp.]